jgi:H+-transporting ATPase
MPIVLGVATILGITGVVASFYAGGQVFHLSRDAIQLLTYLQFSVAVT